MPLISNHELTLSELQEALVIINNKIDLEHYRIGCCTFGILRIHEIKRFYECRTMIETAIAHKEKHEVLT